MWRGAHEAYRHTGHLRGARRPRALWTRCGSGGRPGAHRHRFRLRDLRVHERDPAGPVHDRGRHRGGGPGLPRKPGRQPRRKLHHGVAPGGGRRHLQGADRPRRPHLRLRHDAEDRHLHGALRHRGLCRPREQRPDAADSHHVQPVGRRPAACSTVSRQAATRAASSSAPIRLDTIRVAWVPWAANS